MALRCEQTEVPGVLLFTPDVFRDARGSFLETFQVSKYRAFGVEKPFVQDNCSHSGKGVLRGLHYQLRQPQAKLVQTVRGAIFDVAVDIRRGSQTFGRWVGRTLSDENRQQLFVPEGFAHGFCVLSDEADVWYKCTAEYAPDDDRGLLWSDPAMGIAWPVQNPILSAKDLQHPALAAAGAQLPVYVL